MSHRLSETYPGGYDERITIRLKGIISSSSISFILYLINAQVLKNILTNQKTIYPFTHRHEIFARCYMQCL